MVCITLFKRDSSNWSHDDVRVIVYFKNAYVIQWKYCCSNYWNRLIDGMHLIAVLAGFASFRHKFVGKRVMIKVDNTTVYLAIRKKWSGDPFIMGVIYQMTMESIKYRSSFLSDWVDSASNWKPDYISRNKMVKYFQRMRKMRLFTLESPSKLILPLLQFWPIWLKITLFLHSVLISFLAQKHSVFWHSEKTKNRTLHSASNLQPVQLCVICFRSSSRQTNTIYI